MISKKSILVAVTALALGACSTLGIKNTKQEQINQFAYCAGAHEALGDNSLGQYTLNKEMIDQDDSVSWLTMSGTEMQYAIIRHYARSMSTMDMDKYYDITVDLSKARTAEEMADSIDAGDSFREGQAFAQKFILKHGRDFAHSNEGYEQIAVALDNKCNMQMDAEQGRLEKKFSHKTEANITVRALSQCVGMYETLSNMSTVVSSNKTKGIAQLSGAINAVTYIYVTDDNNEMLSDNANVISSMLESQYSTDYVAEKHGECVDSFRTAIQYVVEGSLE